MSYGSEEAGSSTLLSIRVIPRARKCEISELMEDGTIKVRLTAPPIDGKANLSLVEFLSEILEIPSSRIELISGARGRNKRVLIKGMDKKTTLSRIKNSYRQGK
jgi:uncharacterized protein (TIGR00251 family)